MMHKVYEVCKQGDVYSLSNYLESATFEHQFWLHVLADHSRFIHYSLYPSEKEDIAKATYFIQQFDYLYAQVNVLNETNAITFAHTADGIPISNDMGHEQPHICSGE